MLELDAIEAVPKFATTCSRGSRELMIVSVMLCGLTSLPCSADESAPRTQLRVPVPHQFPALRGISPQFDIGARCVPEMPPISGTQFSPRKHFAPDEPFEARVPRADSLHTTTVWQRLNDYRAKNGVRLVTLWETPGSSISLQAGRHGEPSLQWSSRSMNRGGATRGLLDSVVAASLGAAGIAISQPSRFSQGSTLSTVRPIRPAGIGAFTSHAP